MIADIDLAWPWFNYEAVLYVAARVRPDMRVFEWGCGCSTAFFVNHCAEAMAVEHDAAWHKKVSAALPKAKIQLKLPETTGKKNEEGDPNGYYVQRRKAWFKAYTEAINNVDGRLDIISVDGRNRVGCMRLAIGRVPPGGILVLDNSNRARYRKAVGLVPKSWECRVFEGPGRTDSRKVAFRPDQMSKTRTTIWTRPE